MNGNYIENSRLPAIVRFGSGGMLITMIGLVVGGTIVDIIDLFRPGIKGNGIPAWMWPIMILIWAPGAFGLLASVYSVARYPYLSLATGGGERIITSRNWVWKGLGIIFYVLTPVLMIFAVTTAESLWEFTLQAYLAIVFGFAGFLMATYRREKHVTIASFLELTLGIGIILVPIYIPVLVLGSLRCRRFIKSLYDVGEAAYVVRDVEDEE